MFPENLPGERGRGLTAGARSSKLSYRLRGIGDF